MFWVLFCFVFDAIKWFGLYVVMLGARLVFGTVRLEIFLLVFLVFAVGVVICCFCVCWFILICGWMYCCVCLCLI